VRVDEPARTRATLPQKHQIPASARQPLHAKYSTIVITPPLHEEWPPSAAVRRASASWRTPLQHGQTPRPKRAKRHPPNAVAVEGRTAGEVREERPGTAGGEGARECPAEAQRSARNGASRRCGMSVLFAAHRAVPWREQRAFSKNRQHTACQAASVVVPASLRRVAVPCIEKTAVCRRRVPQKNGGRKRGGREHVRAEK